MQTEVVKYNQAHDIVSEAYSPLGTGKIFEVEELKELAAKYNKSNCTVSTALEFTARILAFTKICS